MIEAKADYAKPPRWIKQIHWLWHQDDVCWRDDRPEQAWFEHFGFPLPKDPGREHWIASVDLGDAVYFLDDNARVYCCSYPGNCAIGIVLGPAVAL